MFYFIVIFSPTEDNLVCSKSSLGLGYNFGRKKLHTEWKIISEIFMCYSVLSSFYLDIKATAVGVSTFPCTSIIIFLIYMK